MKQRLFGVFGIAMPLFSLIVTSAAPASAQTNFTVLRSFSGIPDGAVPFGALVDGKDGAFYGTTAAGGISNYGTIFRVNTDGSRPVILKSFIGSDGSAPLAGLVLSIDGKLFGTTFTGGTSNFGTVFSLGKNGSDFTVLHSFAGGPDGKSPKFPLIVGSDGVLYGTADFADSTNRGTIFRLNQDGTSYSVLHIFTGNPDGQNPTKLLEGSDGNLYGATGFGGPTIAGTVFSIQKDGNGYAILYNFQGRGGDGLSPGAGLVEGSDGALYGTTSHGGTGLGGTVFRLNMDGTGYGILRSFSDAGDDSYEPDTELVEGTDGALYGSTYFGSNGSDNGTIYKLNKDGSGYTILRKFTGTSGDGQTPGALLLMTNGVFYGTTEYGGGGVGGGCVFALGSVPLPPRVAALSASGSTNLMQCAATSGFQYDVQRSTNLSSWSVLASITSTNGGFTFSDSTQLQPVAFYRLQQH